MSLTIVTAHWEEDLEWLKKSKWPVVLIDKEGASASWLTPQHVIPNVGREASAYLKYIIENYDNLPDHVAFIHGHEEAHHHFHDRPLLEVIEGANIHNFGFISLNNFFAEYPFADEDVANGGFIEIEKFWDKFKLPMKKPPHLLIMHVPHCAQFIVARDRIRRHPKTLYEFWYKTIMDEPENTKWPYHFEAVWYLIFGEMWFGSQCDEWFNFPHKRVWRC